jgi:hypothetical protein
MGPTTYFLYRNKVLNKKKNTSNLKTQTKKAKNVRQKEELDYTLGENTLNDGSELSRTGGGIFSKNIGNSTIETVRRDESPMKSQDDLNSLLNA